METNLKIKYLQHNMLDIADFLGCDVKDVVCFSAYPNKDTLKEFEVVSRFGIESVPYIQAIDANHYITYGFGVRFVRHKSGLKMAIVETSTVTPYVLFSSKDVGEDSEKWVKSILEPKRKLTQKPIFSTNLIDKILDETVNLYTKIKDNPEICVRRGILFTGEPGNGKSATCSYIRYLCKEYDYEWIVLTAEKLMRHFANGELDVIFEENTFIFIDDVDINSVFSKDNNLSYALLAAMSGLGQQTNRFIFVTSNSELNDFHHAFCRSGRIDTVYQFNRPTIEDMELFFKARLPEELYNMAYSDDMAQKCFDNEFSFADLKNIQQTITTKHFLNESWSVYNIIDGIVESKKDIHKRVGF